MTDIEQILEELRVFNQERDWDQFHNGKDLAIGLSVEASELLEAFLWKAPEDVNPDKVREELADVLNYAFSTGYFAAFLRIFSSIISLISRLYLSAIWKA